MARAPEPSADEDLVTIIDELERLKAEVRRLTGVKNRAMPEQAAEIHAARTRAHKASAPIPFHMYAEILRQVGRKQFEDENRGKGQGLVKREAYGRHRPRPLRQSA